MPRSDIVSTTPARARVAGLDALRGVAVLLVMINHAHILFAGSGVVGVTIFFVLSGYLITGILTSGVRRTGTVDYRRFYRGRALRLYPPLILMLIVFAIVEGVFDLGGQRGDLPKAIGVSLTYVSNLPGLSTGFDNLFQLWSLSVEWQFYLVWPLVIALVLPRVGRARTLAVTAGVVLVACAGSIIATSPDTYKVYTLPTSWAIALIVGGALRMFREPLARRYDALRERRPWAGTVAVVVAALPLAALCFLQEDARPNAWIDYLLLVPLSAVAAAVLVFVAGEAPSAKGWMRPLLAMGTISYAVYLWDLPMTSWLAAPGAYTADFSFGLLVPSLAAIAAGTASWWLVEKPVLAWRKGLDRRASAPEPERVTAG